MNRKIADIFFNIGGIIIFVSFLILFYSRTFKIYIMIFVFLGTGCIIPSFYFTWKDKYYRGDESAYAFSYFISGCLCFIAELIWIIYIFFK